MWHIPILDYQALKKWNSDTCHNIDLENIMPGEITTGQQSNNKGQVYYMIPLELANWETETENRLPGVDGREKWGVTI